MTTITLKYTSDVDMLFLFQDTARFSIRVYCLVKDGLNEKEIRHHIKDKFENLSFDTWIQQSIIRDMLALDASNPDKNIIFGGKKNFIAKCRGKITNDEWKQHRLRRGFIIQGEKSKCGNRKFELHVDEGYVVLKLNKNEHIRLDIQKMSKNHRRELLKLQALNEAGGCTYTVRVQPHQIAISFEEQVQPAHNLISSRCAGLDLNPSNIGFSILDDKAVKVAWNFDLSNVINEAFDNSYASDSPEMMHIHDKLDHETLEMAKVIVEQCLHHHVKFMFIEKLRFKQGDQGSGKKFNRLCKNLWKKSKFIDNLRRRCHEVGIKLFEVNPMYSSIIGNLMHDYVDATNASIEVARRGFDVIILKNKMFYPELHEKTLKNRWKEIFSEACNSWKDIFKQIKNSDLMVRVHLEHISRVFEVFEMKSHRSRVKTYKFV